MRMPSKGDYQYFKTTALEQKYKALKDENEKLKNGTSLQEMQKRRDYWHEKYEKEHRARIHETQQAKLRYSKEAEKRARYWQNIADDIQEECEAQKKYTAYYMEQNQKLETTIAELRQARAKSDKEKDALIKDLRGQIAALQERLGLNSTNSSIPSSQEPLQAPARKKRHNYNSREKTGKNPGAQPGHKHHGRQMLEPDIKVQHMELPEALKGEEGWVFTGKTKRHQLADLRLIAEVREEEHAVWYNTITHETYCEPFPEDMPNEMNYGPRLKAFVTMLCSYGNMAGRKVKRLLYEASDRRINVSHGWIAERSRELAVKAAPDVHDIFLEVHDSDWAGVDATVTKNNGKREAVGVMHGKTAAFFAWSRKKGAALMSKLPCAPELNFDRFLVSDREMAILNCAKPENHQDCVEHYKRDLKRIIDMEPDRKWAAGMRDLMAEMERAQKTWPPEGPPPEQVTDFKARFEEYLELGFREYAKDPPDKHFLFGINLRKTMAERRDHILRFLDHPEIPCHNNGSEGLIRQHKRALHQKVTFRSGQSIQDHCDYLSLQETWRLQGKEIYSNLKEIFERPGFTRAH